MTLIKDADMSFGTEGDSEDALLPARRPVHTPSPLSGRPSSSSRVLVSTGIEMEKIKEERDEALAAAAQAESERDVARLDRIESRALAARLGANAWAEVIRAGTAALEEEEVLKEIIRSYRSALSLEIGTS